MSNQSAVEQELLELINRARLDPAAEAARDGIDLNEGLPAGTISTASKQPLAMNDILLGTADAHSQDMLTNDYFAHPDQSGNSPQKRMATAGYGPIPPGFTSGENIATFGTTAAITQADELQLEKSLFIDDGVAGRGHRTNILAPVFQEIGVGEKDGTSTQQFSNGPFTGNFAMLTEDFATPPGATTQFLTGVVFNDNVIPDQFYSIGEGRGNVTVAITGGSSVATGSAGGYSEHIDSGTHTITFSGGDEATPAVLTAVISAGTNAKIDLMGQSAIRTSVSVTAVSGISTIIGLGTIGLSLTGGAEADTISGGTGNDTLNGGGGFNTADFSDIASANGALTQISAGDWQIVSADGTDTLLNIEAVKFSDKTVSLGLPSPATVAQFEANKSGYEAIAGGFAISDTEANIIGGLPDLVTAAGQLTSITSTDMPVMVGVAKFTPDRATLDKVVGGFKINGQAVAIQGAVDQLEADQANIISVTSVDTPVAVGIGKFTPDRQVLDKVAGGFNINGQAVAISGALGALQSDTGKIGTITALNGTVTASVASFNADKQTLDKIVGGFAISDTEVNIVAGLPALTADAGHIASITSTDMPVMVGVAKFTPYRAALDKVVGGFKINGQAVAIQGAVDQLEADQANIISVTSVDTLVAVGVGKFTPDRQVLDKVVGGFRINGQSLAISGAFDALSADAKIQSLAFADANPALTLTQTQATNDAALIAKITGSYTENVTNAGSTTTTGHGNGLTITAVAGGHDTITGGGTSETFVFNPSFGQDTITDFSSHLSGVGHDTITLPSAEFANFAAVLADAHPGASGSLVITSSTTPTDVLTLSNLTAANLQAAGADFNFV